MERACPPQGYTSIGSLRLALRTPWLVLMCSGGKVKGECATEVFKDIDLRLLVGVDKAEGRHRHQRDDTDVGIASSCFAGYRASSS